MITRKNPLLDTFIDVENGGEGVDTAIRKMDKEFDNVIEGANATQTELDEVKERVEALDGIDHESFALKSEIPEIVSGSSINVEVNGRENKISVNLPAASATNPDPGLMTQNDKIILENLRNTGETFAGHVVNEDIHVPEWTVSEDVGKVLKLTKSGAEWSMGMGPGEFEGVFSVNGKQGVLALEGEGMTEIRAEGEGKIKITTPVIKEATQDKSGLMSAQDKGKLNSIPNIPIPREEDKGKALVYKEDGSLSWETQATHHLGEIFAYAGTTAPIGAVECKGQAMSKKVHPDLFAVLGYNFGGSGDTFLLPDTYSAGRFLRSRSTIVPVGEEQGDAIRNIEGKVSPGSAWVSLANRSAETNGVFYPVDSSGGFPPTGTYSNTLSQRLGFDASLVVPTADENRPINISVMYCIQISHGYTAPTIIAMDDVIKEIEELKNAAKTHYIGEIFAYAGTTAPMGAVECRGQAMSKIAHPDLFAVIGYNFGGAGDTFHLPDTYSAGRFLRSRSGSVPVGTEQGDAIRNIEGSVRSGLTSAAASGNQVQGTGVFKNSYGTTEATLGYVGNVSGGHKQMSAKFDASDVVPTAEENRPINISVMYCIQISHGYINSTQIDVDALQKEVIELRNKVQYPPMFIQGFKMDYVNSTTISISSGHCKSMDNKHNIDFDSPAHFLTYSNFDQGGTLHIFAILLDDDTVTFVASKSLMEMVPNEKARRRIGSFFIVNEGFIPFKSYMRVEAQTIYFETERITTQSTTAISRKEITVHAPGEITADVLLRLRVLSPSNGNAWANVYSLLADTAVDGPGGMSSPGSYYKYPTIPLLKSKEKASVILDGSGAGAFDISLATRGYTDWRID